MKGFCDIRKIYERLEDEKSREVFDMRLKYSLGECDLFDFYDLVKSEKCRLYGYFYEWLERNIDRENLFVFGCGRIGKYTIDILQNNEIKITGCVDSNVIEKEYNGIEIKPIEEIYPIRNNCKIIIASSVYRLQMLEQLLRNGFVMDQIWFAPFEILRGYVGNQYFDYFDLGKDETFVDCGAYDGMSTVEFFNNAGGEAYLFEANPNNESVINNVLKHNHINNYTIIAKGLYDRDTTLNFSTNKGAGAMIEADGESIKVTSIDNALTNIGRKITYIKMDIEGAEEKAIEGARNIIKRDSPRLAISIYHKKNDFIDIPLQLLDIYPDYRFAMRHYCTMGEETVLYAWR